MMKVHYTLTGILLLIAIAFIVWIVLSADAPMSKNVNTIINSTPINSTSLENTNTVITQDTVDPKNYGLDCELVDTCNGIAAIDCNAAVDGPLYYVEMATNLIIEWCGGYCLSPETESGYCQSCPPEAWTCT